MVSFEYGEVTEKILGLRVVDYLFYLGMDAAIKHIKAKIPPLL